MFSITEQEMIEQHYAQRFPTAERQDSEMLRFPAGCGNDEALCLKYLYAFMPEGDLAAYSSETFLPFVRHALRVRTDMQWGRSIPTDLFLNYVLHYRVNNEAIEDCRESLFQEILPRIRGKSMKEAALEINYWCLEKATYRPTDDRTASPLTIVRNAYGRCGEESVLTVTAMRSAGIPARQCYVPRWSHCDDNHAWVEVWIDGKWSFLGACEPEPVLNRGWFTAAASKAMLVHSRVFSTYTGSSEKVLRHSGLMTIVNNLETYADTRLLTVLIRDGAGQPVPGATVRLEIPNYAELFPIAELKTDSKGEAACYTGLGDLFLHVCKDGRFLTRKVDIRTENRVELDFSTAVVLQDGVQELDMVPPEEAQDRLEELTEEQNQLHKFKIDKAESIRHTYEETFYTRESALRKVDKLDGGKESAAGFLVKSLGNYPEMEKFLLAGRNTTWKLKLLETLSDKDYTDLKADMLTEHLQYALEYEHKYSEEIFTRYVLSPRIGLEQITPYRAFLHRFFEPEQKEHFRRHPPLVQEYVASHVRDCGTREYPPLVASPAGLLKLGSGSLLSRKTLFVAICRTLGIPARLNPVTKEPEYLQNEDWIGVYETATGTERTATGQGNGMLVLRKNAEDGLNYMQHFTIGILENGVYKTLDYSACTWENNSFRLEPRPGHYRIVLSGRQIDGSVLVRLIHIEVKEKEAAEVLVELRKNQMESLLKTLPLTDLRLVENTGLECKFGELVSHCPAGIAAVIDAGKEPTEHILNELLELKEEIAHSGTPVTLITGTEDDFSNGTLQKVLHDIPSARVFVCKDRGFLSGLFRQVKMGDHRLPLSMVVDHHLQAKFAFSNYNVGTAGLLLQIVRLIR